MQRRRLRAWSGALHADGSKWRLALESLVGEAVKALCEDGLLVIVTLVDGEGAFQSETQHLKPAQAVLDAVGKVEGLETVHHECYRQVDCHDIGRGVDEEHVHYVLRATCIREPCRPSFRARVRGCVGDEPVDNR